MVIINKLIAEECPVLLKDLNEKSLVLLVYYRSYVRHEFSAYQGLQKLTRNVQLPFKHKKGKSLSSDKKQFNRQQSSIRIRVKRKIRELKVFKILSEKYRNYGKKQQPSGQNYIP